MPRTESHIRIMISFWLMLFHEPTDGSAMPEVWTAPDLKRIAVKLPDTRLHSDVDGKLATYFGRYTWGQVLLNGTDNLTTRQAGNSSMILVKRV